MAFYEDRSYLTLPILGTVLNGSETSATLYLALMRISCHPSLASVFSTQNLLDVQRCGLSVRLDNVDYEYIGARSQSQIAFSFRSF